MNDIILVLFNSVLSPQSSVARTTRRNTTPRLPSAGPEALSPPQFSVLSGAYNPAKHHSKIAQRRAGGPQSSSVLSPQSSVLSPILYGRAVLSMCKIVLVRMSAS